MKVSNELFKITYQKKIPLICTFEITKKCNLNCRHCYLTGVNNPKKEAELTTEQIKSILFQLSKTGTLYLVFTGGEIFLRKDIIELCSYAKKLNFDLRLFTNGTLITEKIAQTLSALDLSSVDISIYGRPKTHDFITGSSGSFSKALKSIRLLIDKNIKVTIKSPVMNINLKDYDWLKAFAKKLNVVINFDPTITPKNNGDTSILKYRLNGQEMEKLFSNEKHIFECSQSEYLKKDSNNNFDDLLCSAGHNLIAIDSFGSLYPCLQLPIFLGSLKNMKLSSIWNKKNKSLINYRNISSSNLKECLNCNLIEFCQRCPGLALLENKDITGPAKIACKIAEIKKFKIASSLRDSQ